MHIRIELPRDRQAVFAVHVAAFETGAEACLVDELRDSAADFISLVALFDKAVVGHILFTPVSLDSDPDARIMGLAPMAVLPERQGSGIGSKLVASGLHRCSDAGYAAVVVLGHPEYYPKFGFVPASQFGLGCEYDVPDEVFMALELRSAYLAAVNGTVRYDKAFATL